VDRAVTDPIRTPVDSEASPGFWRRRVVDPLVGFLKQGFTPAALARAIALGTVCGVFPFFGATTLLTLGTGLAFRLNQPVMQTVNQLLGPVQLVLIPVFVQGGAWMLGADTDQFSVTAMLSAARGLPVWEFLQQFGQAGIYAFVAWLAAAPVLFTAVLFTVRPPLRRLAKARAGMGGLK